MCYIEFRWMFVMHSVEWVGPVVGVVFSPAVNVVRERAREPELVYRP